MAKQHNPRFLQIVTEARARIEECTVQDVADRLARKEPFELVDVREDHEWSQGRLPGAKHLGRGILERDVEKLFPDPATPLVLYCGGGYRSALAAWSLKQMGYTNVLSMDGGYSGWKGASLPIEGPEGG